MFNWIIGLFQKPPVVVAPLPESPELIAFKKEQYRQAMAAFRDIVNKENEQRREIAEAADIKCPKCDNTEGVVDNIIRVKGEINGSGSGSIFGFSSHIHGSIDTNPVNTCPKCGNQWKKSVLYLTDQSVYTEMRIEHLHYAIDGLKGVDKTTFDPNDIREKCNSLEEKKAEALKNAEYWKTEAIAIWNPYCIEVIQEIAKLSRRYYEREEQVLERFNTKDMQKYLGLQTASEMMAEANGNGCCARNATIV
jgi:predicted nucleic-acid-binding Zn-ribbon protein